jgi:ABC-type amino acid transport substrate-binding protein
MELPFVTAAAPHSNSPNGMGSCAAHDYYAAHEGKGWVKLVGPEFDPVQIAIAMQLDNPLRKKVNRALVVLRENGTYQQIYDKWFGGP